MKRLFLAGSLIFISFACLLSPVKSDSSVETLVSKELTKLPVEEPTPEVSQEIPRLPAPAIPAATPMPTTMDLSTFTPVPPLELPAPSDNSSGGTVIYSVTGSAQKAMITYMNQDGGMEQGYFDLPFKKELILKSGLMLSLVAQNQGASGSITCQILVNDRVIKQADSSGAYVLVSCAEVIF